MNVRVITVSRQLGSGGEDIARGVADRLGFRYLDDEVIQRAERDAGLPRSVLEGAEHSPSLATRLSERLAASPGWMALAWSAPIPLIANPLYSSQHYRHVIEEVIRELPRRGDAVLLGHGGQVILGDRWDTVKVLISGSAALRVMRVRQRLMLDQAEAEVAVNQSDADRTTYFDRIYRVDWLSPTLYDLCINTDHVSDDAAIEAICLLERSR